VVSDERSNSIIVTASPSLQEAVAQLLQHSRALEPFSPVIDRFLDFDTRKPTAYLDLDTGQYLDRAYTFPFGVDSTPPGMDLRTSDYESDTHARLAINMALKPVDTNRWDATPAEIRKELAMTRRQAEVRLVASEVPQLFFFRTSEGGQGILQLQVGPIMDGSHQVHIFYRLLSPSTLGKASAPGDGAEDSENQTAPAGETGG
jgi:hypothetical protein